MCLIRIRLLTKLIVHIVYLIQDRSGTDRGISLVVTVETMPREKSKGARFFMRRQFHLTFESKRPDPFDVSFDVSDPFDVS